MESMIQRVVRQIREVQLTNNITLATNAVQRDSIINQFGEDVNVVTEPERRDTFPAIAFADAADACWSAILAHDLLAFASAYKASFNAQIALCSLQW